MNRSELADAMLKGAKTPGVKEDDSDYVNTYHDIDGGPCFACALGCALIGKQEGDFRQAEGAFNQAHKDCKYSKTSTAILAEMLDISPMLADEVEGRHISGQSIEQIAAWLKA